MISIIKHGTSYTPDNVILQCKECECVFMVDDLNQHEQVIVKDENNPDRSYTALPCPECYLPVELKPAL